MELHAGNGREHVANPLRALRAAAHTKRHVRANGRTNFEERFFVYLAVDLLQAVERCRRVRAAAAHARFRGNALDDANLRAPTGQRTVSFRRAANGVVVGQQHARAGDHNVARALHRHRIVQIDGLHDGVERVVPVRSFIEHAER